MRLYTKLLVSFLFCICTLAPGLSGSKAYGLCGPDSCLGPWTYSSITIPVPTFETCLIECRYRWRECTDQGGNRRFEFKIYMFALPSGDSIGCRSLLDSLWTPAGDPDWDLIKFIFRESNMTVALALFKKEYNDASSWDKWRFECPNYNQTTYSLSSRTCTKLAMYYTFMPGFPWPWYRFEEYPCDDEVCCLQTTRICMDPGTGQPVILQNTFQYQGGECQTGAPPIEGAAFTSDCFQQCYDD